MSSADKKEQPKRLLLTDRQCRLFLKDMHEFGYPRLTFETVRELADKYSRGEEMTCVIGMLMQDQIETALKHRAESNK